MLNTKGLYHAQRGHDEILKPYLVYQRKQVNDGVWRPIIAFLLFIVWLESILWFVVK